MKNLTLRVDEKILAAARRHAVENGLSVNQLVREYLAGLARLHDRAGQARRRIRELSDRSNARI